MKKRIGNDITFTWHIYRKSGEEQVPESFTDKDVEVKLMSPLKQPVTIEDVTIATGVVTFTFRGKHQVTLGNYVAVLQENRGEDGMATLDVVNAVTLVPHSYMEDDGDDGDVIEAESVELTSTITAGGGIVQQQADWAQTDDTAVDFIKNKPDVVSVGEDGVTVNKQLLRLLRDTDNKRQAVVLNTPEEGYAYAAVLDNLEDTFIQIYPWGIFFHKDGTYGGYLRTDPTNHPGRLLFYNKMLAYIDDLASLVDGGAYNTQTKEIELTHGNTVLARIDARAFVKDGMVDSVVIENGYIVITFNTDAGKQDISLALTDIFNPANYYDKTAMDALLAGKQDTITDLPAIRSGAQAGATAVQPADLAAVATSGSYNDLTDKPTLDDLNKDSNLYALDNSNEDYATSVEELLTQGTAIPISHDIEGAKLRVYTQEGGTERENESVALLHPSDNEITFSDGVTFTAYQSGNNYYVGLKWNFFDNTREGYIHGIIEVTCEVAGILKLYFFDCDMHENAYFKKNGQTTNVKLNNGVLSFDVEAGDVLTVSPTYKDGYQWVGLIGMSITGKYPVSKFANDAEYVTKDFVNSSIATATATYRGSYNLVSDLSLSVSATQQQIAEALATKMAALSITPDNNDYCFVQIPTADATPTEIARIDRYKYDGTAWAYEYSLNNSSFTAAQWAALNSGITSGLVTKLSDLPTATELATLLAGKASTQQLAGKEDITPIEAVASGTTAITAQVNKYYEVDGTVSSLTVTLPTPTANTEVTMVVVHLTIGNNPLIVVTSVNEVVKFSAAYSVVANKEYELSCLYNGSKWIVSSMEVAV